MKYYGRIFLLCLSLFSLSIFILTKNINLLILLVFFIHAIISWIVGRWYDQYHFLSYRDPLTGVYNRRYVYKTFSKKFNYARKNNNKIGIVIIDINYFKCINDKFGHEYGDFILKELCRIVQFHLHSEDILARWGGDEFMLLVNQDKNLFIAK